MRNIIVCLKVVPKSENIIFDPVTKRLDRSKAENQINEADKTAIEIALRIREKQGGRVILLSMGPPLFENFLKLGVAMGADDAILLSDRNFGGADTYPTALVLSTAIAQIGNYDLVLAGEESSDAALGQLPGQIAEFLDIPQVLFATSVEAEGEKLRVKRRIKGGHETVETSLPVMVSVEMGAVQPRFPDFKKMKWALSQFHLTVWSSRDLGLREEVTGIKGSFTFVRGLSEITPSRRKRVFIEGDVAAKSAKLAELLRERPRT
jgi:electron transfer flavoprotein beta subunit